MTYIYQEKNQQRQYGKIASNVPARQEKLLE